MATLEQCLNFESAIEQATLNAFFDAYGVRLRGMLPSGLAPHQFIGAQFTKGAAQDHHHVFADGTEMVDAYQGTLSFFVKTDRQADRIQGNPLNHELCAQVRAFMVDGAKKINAKLTLHKITSWPEPQSGDIRAEDDLYDYTELPYSLTFCVINTAWPVALP